MTTVPKGSSIQLERSPDGSSHFSWKKPDGGPLKYLFGFFIVIWLLGWGFGLLTAIRHLTNSSAAPHAFLLIWLLLWSMGGVFAFAFAYLILRPKKPERLSLRADGFDYDSGTSSPLATLLLMRSLTNPFVFWSDFFKKRIVLSGLKREETSFVLEKNPARIYFDHDSKRIEIGCGLREPEIEWLHAQIAERNRF